MAKNWTLLLPLFIAGCIILMLFKVVSHNPFKRQSAFINRTAPHFHVQSVVDASSFDHTMLEGKITVLHFWASWCGYCQQEYLGLPSLADSVQQIQWIGINFKDTLERGKRLLQKGKNPYHATGFDPAGKMAIDFGVTGAPETFLIDAEQKIRLHFQGPLTQEMWEEEFLPLIRKLQKESGLLPTQ